MIADIAFGFTVRVGRAGLAPVRLAARAPLIGPAVRWVGDDLAVEGRALRAWAFDLLESPVVERELDKVLAGPLTDAVARSLATNRVAERVAAQVLAQLDIARIVTAVLEDARTEQVVEHVLSSREMQLVIGHIASSPELLAAMTQHTETLAEEMVTDVRERAQRVDDLAERTVRGWLRRPPRPRPV
jgi:hypothetical protein